MTAQSEHRGYSRRRTISPRNFNFYQARLTFYSVKEKKTFSKLTAHSAVSQPSPETQNPQSGKNLANSCSELFHHQQETRQGERGGQRGTQSTRTGVARPEVGPAVDLEVLKV